MLFHLVGPFRRPVAAFRTASSPRKPLLLSY
jgi:hypothetical protein